DAGVCRQRCRVDENARVSQRRGQRRANQIRAVRQSRHLPAFATDRQQVTLARIEAEPYDSCLARDRLGRNQIRPRIAQRRNLARYPIAKNIGALQLRAVRASVNDTSNDRTTGVLIDGIYPTDTCWSATRLGARARSLAI